MKETKIKIPAMMSNRIVLKGIQEPESTLIERLMIVNYKVGSMNEHLLKYHKLGSAVQKEEFKTNLAETMCHIITIAMTQGWDVTELVNMGWDKIGDRFEDFKRGVWIDRSVKL